MHPSILTLVMLSDVQSRILLLSLLPAYLIFENLLLVIKFVGLWSWYSFLILLFLAVLWRYYKDNLKSLCRVTTQPLWLEKFYYYQSEICRYLIYICQESEWCNSLHACLKYKRFRVQFPVQVKISLLKY
jgi:hypothetical protein